MIVTNPNCSTIVLTMALGPLKQFGIRARDGGHDAGCFGRGLSRRGVDGYYANVVPFIGGEEEKMQQETQKILGDFAGKQIAPLDAKVSAHCNRVAVVDGHTVAASVEFEKRPSRSRGRRQRW